MRQARTETGKEHAGQGNPEQRRQIHEAQAVGRQGHLHGHQQGEHADDLLQVRALDQRGGLGPYPGAEQDAHGHPHEDRPLHRATAVVLEDGVDRGEDNGRQRRADCQVGQHRGVEALQGE
uniref:Uncharacterized protein n=1 Tax=Steinernema glaseri TaxID=37863 RepID=A0A1I7YKE3_9BILA